MQASETTTSTLQRLCKPWGMLLLAVALCACAEQNTAPQRTQQALSQIKCDELVLRLKARRGTAHHDNLLSLAAQMRSPEVRPRFPYI